MEVQAPSPVPETKALVPAPAKNSKKARSTTSRRRNETQGQKKKSRIKNPPADEKPPADVKPLAATSSPSASDSKPESSPGDLSDQTTSPASSIKVEDNASLHSSEVRAIECVAQNMVGLMIIAPMHTGVPCGNALDASCKYISPDLKIQRWEIDLLGKLFLKFS